MVVRTQWARDDEYYLPFYRDLSYRMAQIHQITGQHRLDPDNQDYADGLYWSRRWEYPWAIEQAMPREGMRVLDVGCGLAPFLIYLGQIGCEAYGSDPGYGSGDGLCGYAEDFGTPHIVEIRKESMSKLSWEKGSFDLVFCLSVLEHVSPFGEIESGMEEMKRVLKPNGKLIVTLDATGEWERCSNLVMAVFTNGNQFTNLLDRERPSTKYPYNVLGMVLEK